ncbi:L,D-transpeptidase [Streptacidiphilus cavernicola]|uniref:Ig-like domain-containing protein n=1 Tax=Streptacidiphilus cavernicola TaxID=3342716 RepID=A0ABV6VSR4_9ACTN
MRIRFLAAAVALTAPLALCGCSGGSGSDNGAPGPETPVDTASMVSVSAAGKTAVDPSVPLVVTAAKGTLTDVTVTAANGRMVGGAVAADDRSWKSTTPLSAGQHYTVRVSSDDGDGGRGTTVEQFSTLPASKTLTVTLAPGNKTVYGVGEPITATLNLPVHDKAARQAVERGLTVSSSPSVLGGWYWVDDKTLHFRPEGYWPAHAQISASFDMEGVQVGNGVYGGAPSTVSFGTGDSLLALTDAGSDYMTVYRNGKVLRKIPITTGKPGFSTRNGIKVVLEQAQTVFMNSSTVGIAAGSSNAYAMNVYWDTRVTWSGEYVHAAPWSEGSQGVSNVSHGCTGMSTDNAHWFYDTFHVGDLVQVINSQGHEMEPFGNGFGDWNLSWSAWQKGSALGKPVQTSALKAAVGAPGSMQVGLIRPQA